MMKKALVTGGGGFIGSRLVRSLLREGNFVRVLDLQEGRLAKDRDANLEFVGLGADHVEGGIVDQETVDEAAKGVDVVYHLGLNWDGHSWGGRLPLADLLDVNIRGTLSLLEAATRPWVKHFLYPNSVALYAKSGSPAVD